MSSTLDTRELDNLIARNPARAAGIVKTTALSLEARVKVSMKAGKWRPYRRGTKTHWSSAPGAPPAPDTGTLLNSIQASKQSQLTWHVSDGVEYGIYLELGTSRMAARPFMVPAVEKERPEWVRRWEELLK